MAKTTSEIDLTEPAATKQVLDAKLQFRLRADDGVTRFE
jgi:hypothetical protein